MPHFDVLPAPRRYNKLRLLGYDYNSTRKLCSITLIADSGESELHRDEFCESRVCFTGGFLSVYGVHGLRGLNGDGL